MGKFQIKHSRSEKFFSGTKIRPIILSQKTAIKTHVERKLLCFSQLALPAIQADPRNVKQTECVYIAEVSFKNLLGLIRCIDFAIEKNVRFVGELRNLFSNLGDTIAFQQAGDIKPDLQNLIITLHH